MYLAYVLTIFLAFYLVEVAAGAQQGTLRSTACSWGAAEEGGGRRAGWHKIEQPSRDRWGTRTGEKMTWEGATDSRLCIATYRQTCAQWNFATTITTTTTTTTTTTAKGNKNYKHHASNMPNANFIRPAWFIREAASSNQVVIIWIERTIELIQTGS